MAKQDGALGALFHTAYSNMDCGDSYRLAEAL